MMNVRNARGAPGVRSVRLAPEDPERTGAYVVVFRETCDPTAAADHIERVIGRPPARSRDFGTRSRGLVADLHERGAALFDEFGLAVVDPWRCGVTALAVERLADLDDVVTVRPEYRMHAIGWLDWLPCFGRPRPRPIPGPQPPMPGGPAPGAPGPARLTWGIAAVGAGTSAFTGEGIRIAVLDTGIDLTHPDFAGRAIVPETFVRGESVQDGNGHGTHVAGTAAGPRAPAGVPRYGVAPQAELFIGKVLDDRGSGREGDILAGISWALRNACHVVSMSLGRRALPGDSTGDYDRIGRIALAQGALIVAAAGNESERARGVIAPVGSPANARSIVAVAAIDIERAVADFSNGGLEPDGGAIDICAPGVDVLSATPGPVRHQEFSGTSMATPHVAGVAALLAQSNTALRGEALWRALAKSAQPVGLPARDGGAGLAQAPQTVGVA